MKCSECDKMFSTLYNLRKHAKKFHPDKVNVVAPKKKFAYSCEACKRKFNLLRDFTLHKKSHLTEMAPKKLVSKLKCALCQFNAAKAELLVHFKTEHGVQITTEIFEFNSSEEFFVWKNKLENSTRANFVKQRGNFCTSKSKTIIRYDCNRSGNYNSKAKGLRHLKTQGSNKINGFCPACIKVEIKNNTYRVSLINQHVGHQHDLGHLSLTLAERETLANQMALKIPFTEILNQVRDTAQGSQLERIHLLTKRDLYNIKRSFNLHSTVVRHQNDNDIAGLDGCNSRISEKEMVDEAQIIKEKEKIKTNLIPNLLKIVDNISYMEQVDAFHKLCAPIAPTLSAIAVRHEEMIKKTAALDNFPHDKKIIPQRGNILHSTRKKRKNKPVCLTVPTIEEKKDILRSILDQHTYT